MSTSAYVSLSVSISSLSLSPNIQTCACVNGLYMGLQVVIRVFRAF